MTHMSSSLPESLVSKTQNVLYIFDSHLLLRYFQSLLRYFQFTQIIIGTIDKVCLKWSNISAFWVLFDQSSDPRFSLQKIASCSFTLFSKRVKLQLGNLWVLKRVSLPLKLVVKNSQRNILSCVVTLTGNYCHFDIFLLHCTTKYQKHTLVQSSTVRGTVQQKKVKFATIAVSVTVHDRIFRCKFLMTNWRSNVTRFSLQKIASCSLPLFSKRVKLQLGNLWVLKRVSLPLKLVVKNYQRNILSCVITLTGNYCHFDILTRIFENLKMYYAYLTRISYSDIWYLLRYFQFTQIIIGTIAKVCLKYSNISAFWLQNSATFDTNILVWHTRVQVGLKVWCQNLKMYYAYLTRISYSDIWYLLRLLLKIWVQISE